MAPSLVAIAGPLRGEIVQLIQDALAIERAIVLGSAERVQPEDLPESVLEHAGHSEEFSTYHHAVRQAKQQIVMAALARAEGSRAEAARQLGLSAQSSSLSPESEHQRTHSRCSGSSMRRAGTRRDREDRTDRLRRDL